MENEQIGQEKRKWGMPMGLAVDMVNAIPENHEGTRTYLSGVIENNPEAALEVFFILTGSSKTEDVLNNFRSSSEG